jgi:hypothetical protein
MSAMRRLPGSQKSPPGLEWTILKRLPAVALGTLAVPALWYALAYWFPAPADGESLEKYLTGVGIAAIATAATAWTAVFTLAIGCGIVVLMKGPAYVADHYPLVDADAPADAAQPGDADRQRRAGP